MIKTEKVSLPLPPPHLKLLLCLDPFTVQSNPRTPSVTDDNSHKMSTSFRSLPVKIHLRTTKTGRNVHGKHHKGEILSTHIIRLNQSFPLKI